MNVRSYIQPGRTWILTTGAMVLRRCRTMWHSRPRLCTWHGHPAHDSLAGSQYHKVSGPGATPAPSATGGLPASALFLRLSSAVATALATASLTLAAETIENSPHDLSVQSPNQVRAVAEEQICIFCHAPHSGPSSPAAWNRHSTSVFYRVYRSTTSDARTDQPYTASRMCLSCHDGTMPIGPGPLPAGRRPHPHDQPAHAARPLEPDDQPVRRPPDLHAIRPRPQQRRPRALRPPADQPATAPRAPQRGRLHDLPRPAQQSNRATSCACPPNAASCARPATTCSAGP